METAERYRQIIVDHLAVDAEKVVDGANFVEDLGADSLDVMELAMATEEWFAIEISDDEAADTETFGQGLVLIEAKLAVKAVAAG